MRHAGSTLAVLCCAGLVVASAQGPPENPDDLVARHIAARGGLSRIKAVRTIRMTRTVPTIGATLNVVIYKKRPGFYRSEQSAPGRPQVVRALDETGLWELQGGKVVRRPDAMATELRELDADIDGMLVDYRQKGHTVEYAGRGTEAGVAVHKLNVTLKSGAVRQVLLDAQTMLERKQIGQVTLPPDRRVAVTVLFHDYRDVGGLKFPFAIDEDRDAMGQTFAFYVNEIELDVPLDDAMFRAPAAGQQP
jgi:hypothetical protein